MKPPCSSPCSQRSATGPYSKPDECSPGRVPVRSILIVSCHLCSGLLTGIFPKQDDCSPDPVSVRSILIISYCLWPGFITGIFSEPDECSPDRLSIMSILIVSCRLWQGLFNCHLPPVLCNENVLCISCFLHACRMPLSSSPLLYNYLNNTVRRVQITKFLIMQFSPLLYYNVCYVSNCSQSPPSTFLLESERLCFTLV